MKRYESRTCTFAVPGDWVAEPPFAFREPGEEGNRMGAQILERSLADMPSAASYARDQKLILAELYEGFELLQECPQRLEGPGEGYAVTFKYLDEEEYPSRGRMIFYTCGPQVCQLFLSGPEGDDPERDRLFDSIARTFSFRDAEVFAGAKAGGLTFEILRLPQAEAAKAWPGAWSKFPRCCVELPLPIGWEVTTDERDDVVFRRGSAEIRLHRELGESSEADAWFTARMKRLQKQGDRLIGTFRGEIENGRYSALIYEERGVVRTWKTAARTWGFALFLADQQSLTWTLSAAESNFSALCQFLESLAASSISLESTEWETKLVEPWVDYVLKGAWQAEAPGLYVSLQEPLSFIQLNLEPTTVSLEKLRPTILQSMRQGLDLDERVEDSVLGTWGQHDALYYSVDGSESSTGGEVSVRSVWVSKDLQVYCVLVRGANSLQATALSRELLAAFRPS